MRWLSSLLALLIVLSAFGQAARKAVTTTPDTPHLAFVKEFVRELSAVEDIRASSEAEMKQDQATQNQTNSSLSSNMIHTSTLYKLELGSEIETLNGMHLSKPYDFLIPTLTGFYKAKIGVWDQMGIIATKFLETPKPGVDYGSLVAQMSQLRARLDLRIRASFKCLRQYS